MVGTLDKSGRGKSDEKWSDFRYIFDDRANKIYLFIHRLWSIREKGWKMTSSFYLEQLSEQWFDLLK